MSLSVAVEQRLGAFRLDARFEGRGRLTALFGPSGSGKSSLVALVAGLAKPDAGRIALGDTVFADTRARLFVPPHRRRVSVVFQDARLFPHLSVRANLAFGGWFAARVPRAEADREFARVVTLLGIEPLLARRPAKLSGGEKQRVAIGRALLSRPRLLLMDEPLAALDDARKAEILPYVERLRDEAGVPILLVSHAVSEVLRLSDDLVALEAGRVVAQGAPAEVLARLDRLPAGIERDDGADLDAVVAGTDAAFALTVLRCGSQTLLVPRIPDAASGTRLRLRVRARDVLLSAGMPRGLSALNAWPARVRTFASDGEAGLLVRLDCGAGVELLARVTRRSFAAMELQAGSPVHAVLKAVSFDRRPAGGFPGSSARIEL